MDQVPQFPEIPVTIGLHQVEVKPVRWLWPGRVPLSKITVLDGDPGLGKSLMTLDLAARVTTAAAMPDGSRPDFESPSGVVLLSAEDDIADTILPRFLAAGGDPKRCRVLTAVMVLGEGDRYPTLANIGALDLACDEVGARLIVVDPLAAYTAKADSHVDADIRQLLMPIAQLAATKAVAVFLIRHLNKSGGTTALYRGGGSIGIIAAARSGLLAALDPDDPAKRRRVLAVTKANLAEPAASLAYHIARLIPDDPSSPVRIEWEGESTQTAESLVGDAEEQSARSEAAEWLTSYLASKGGEAGANDALRAAEVNGIKKTRLHRARKELGVETRQNGFHGGWAWRLPTDPTDSQNTGTGICESVKPVWGCAVCGARDWRRSDGGTGWVCNACFPAEEWPVG